MDTLISSKEKLAECARDLLTCSCVLEPNIDSTIRRARVTCAISELMGKSPDDATYQLIGNVMQQEEIYGVE